MSAFFEYPKASEFGRAVPKAKIYGHAGASTRIRQLFVDQVDQIVWRYKLAPETVNLPATKSVTEIQVFEVNLRTPDLAEDILLAIDRAVAFPIIFELVQAGKRKTVAAYKRPSAADAVKWVVSAYFSSGWEAEDKPRQSLPTALNLGALYDRLLSALMPQGVGSTEPLGVRVERIEAIRAKEREIARIKVRLSREAQFNKKVAINAELRETTKQLKSLGDGQKASAEEG